MGPIFCTCGQSEKPLLSFTKLINAVNLLWRLTSQRNGRPVSLGLICFIMAKNCCLSAQIGSIEHINIIVPFAAWDPFNLKIISGGNPHITTKPTKRGYLVSYCHVKNCIDMNRNSIECRSRKTGRNGHENIPGNNPALEKLYAINPWETELAFPFRACTGQVSAAYHGKGIQLPGQVDLRVGLLQMGRGRNNIRKQPDQICSNMVTSKKRKVHTWLSDQQDWFPFFIYDTWNLNRVTTMQEEQARVKKVQALRCNLQQGSVLRCSLKAFKKAPGSHCLNGWNHSLSKKRLPVPIPTSTEVSVLIKLINGGQGISERDQGQTSTSRLVGWLGQTSLNSQFAFVARTFAPFWNPKCDWIVHETHTWEFCFSHYFAAFEKGAK